jgi:hypothetical protein
MFKHDAEAYTGIKKKVYEFWNNIQSIDKLLKDKVDPYVIIQEYPCPIAIGSQVWWVGTFSMQNEAEFFREWAEILSRVGLQHLFLDLLKDGLELYKYMKLYDKVQKELLKLLYNILKKQQYFYCESNNKLYKTNKVSWRYFKKYITKEAIMQICFIIYTYNYDASKNSLTLIARRSALGEMSETCMYSWLQNCTGLTGKFLIDQLPSYDWYNPEQQKSTMESEAVNG